jgi:hypothetical protein
MLRIKRSLAGLSLGLGLGAMLLVGGAGLALAADVVVTQTLSPGTRSSRVTGMTLAQTPYSHAAQSTTGLVTLIVDDSSGSGQGWNVQVQSSAFVYSGPNQGKDIPAANFAVVAANTPTATAGQPVDAAAGPNAPASGSTGSLDIPRKTLHAQANAGMGTYTQQLEVHLTIPANSLAGSYTGTVTTTIAAAP